MLLCVALQLPFFRVHGIKSLIFHLHRYSLLSYQYYKEILMSSNAFTLCLFVALLSGLGLFSSQFVAMFMKRFINSKRQKTAVVTQIILPLFLVICGLSFMLSSTTVQDNPSRALKLSMLKAKESSLTTFFADYRSGAAQDTTLKEV